MGGGALTQLVAVGLQDTHIQQGDVRHTYWQTAYRRYTNFSLESIPQVFSGVVAFGSKLSCTVSRNADLVRGLFFEVTMKRGTGPAFYSGEHLFKYVDVEIGGQRIDFVTNTWLRIYDELHRDVDQREAHKQMTDFEDAPPGTIKRFYVHVPFWFSSNSGLALPLIALQYHEVKVNIELEQAENIPGVDGSHAPDCTMYCDYVFLDTDERRLFAQTQHEYLIEQTQLMRSYIFPRATKVKHTVALDFNHPTKYLAWVLKPNDASHAIFTSNGSVEGLEPNEVYGPVASVELQLNGTDRFAQRRGSYFRLCHAFQHFRKAPSVGVYVYSFALYPREHTPSGTMNFSRVDSAIMRLETKAATLTDAAAATSEDQTMVAALNQSKLEVYAKNYNVLLVQHGMGGVMFST
jgi:hypothetical protein